MKHHVKAKPTKAWAVRFRDGTIHPDSISKHMETARGTMDADRVGSTVIRVWVAPVAGYAKPKPAPVRKRGGR